MWRFPHPIPSKNKSIKSVLIKLWYQQNMSYIKKTSFLGIFLLENIKKQIGGYFSYCLDNHQGKKTSNLCDTHYNLNFKQIHLIPQKWTASFLCLMSHEYFTVILMHKVNTRNKFMDMSVWYFVALLGFWAEQYSISDLAFFWIKTFLQFK